MDGRYFRLKPISTEPCTHLSGKSQYLASRIQRSGNYGCRASAVVTLVEIRNCLPSSIKHSHSAGAPTRMSRQKRTPITQLGAQFRVNVACKVPIMQRGTHLLLQYCKKTEEVSFMSCESLALLRLGCFTKPASHFPTSGDDEAYTRQLVHARAPPCM